MPAVKFFAILDLERKFSLFSMPVLRYDKAGILNIKECKD
jgi:hypothetical protein